MVSYGNIIIRKFGDFPYHVGCYIYLLNGQVYHGAKQGQVICSGELALPMLHIHKTSVT